MQLPILFLALGALAASCAQEPAPPVTGAPEPTAAAPFPTPPQFVNWECPAGWLAKPMADRGFSACEPPPPAQSCPDGTMAVVGSALCEEIGDPCPAGDWPADLPTEARTIYVKAGATGDGSSESSPLGTINQAIAAARSETVIAVAKGRYAEGVNTGKTVTIWGACVAGVTLIGPAGTPSLGTLGVDGTMTVRNLTITGPRYGVVVASLGTLRGRGVRITSATGIGLVTSGGVELESLLIEDTGSLANKTLGTGLKAFAGARVTLTRALIDNNRSAGVLADGQRTQVSLTRVAITNTQMNEGDQSGGFGVRVTAGAEVVLTRALIDHNRVAGVVAGGPSTKITLTDVTITHTQAQRSNKQFGMGVQALSGAHVNLTRALIDNNRTAGLAVRDQGTELTLIDVAISNTQSQESNQRFGAGVQASDGAHVSLSRAVIDQNRAVGVMAFDEGTKITLTDVAISNTQSQESNRLFGTGVQASEGAHVAVTRALMDHNRYTSVFAGGRGSEVTLTDAVITNTLPTERTTEDGMGVSVAADASVSLNSCRVAHNRVAGVLAMVNGAMTIASSEISGTLTGKVRLLGADGVSSDGPQHEGLGDGIMVLSGSSAHITGVRVSGNARAGLLFSDGGGKVESVTSTGNLYGLGVQGNSAPSADACVFSGNSGQDQLNDGNLPVPNAPMAVASATP